MIEAKTFYITKRVNDHEYFVKTASNRGDRIKVVWTRSIFKAKWFNGTFNIRKFVRDYKIAGAYVTRITAGIQIDQVEIHDG